MSLKPQYTQIWNTIKDTFDLNFIDFNKLNKQFEIYDAFKANGGVGIAEACTGFGKTVIAIIAIKSMNRIAPQNKTIVVLPNTNLYEDWTDPIRGYIVIHKLKNVSVFVVNSYTMSMEKHECSFLILDEVHRYSRDESKYFSKTLENTTYKYVLGLSGSLNKQERLFLEQHEIPRIAEITQSEAEANNWISDSIVYNYGIEVDEELKEKLKTLDDIHNSAFKKFGFKFDVARGCSMGKGNYYKSNRLNLNLSGEQWRLWLARENQWNGDDSHFWSPKNIAKYANQWNFSITQRQQLLFNNKEKLEISKQILEKFNLISIVFSESIDFIKSLEKNIGSNARCYHSQLSTVLFKDKSKKEIIAVKIEKSDLYSLLSDGYHYDISEIKKKYPEATKVGADTLKKFIKEGFQAGEFKFLLTAKALDEGYDFKSIRLGLIASGKGVVRQQIQRSGRILRNDENKLAIIINLYIKESQEEKWLEARQKYIPKSKITWISDINEIVLEKEKEEQFII